MGEIDARLWIEHESEVFASLLDPAALSRRVPGCPQWTLLDLAWHLGRVQRAWASIVGAGADVEPTFAETASGPTDARELQDWMRASTRELLEALHATPADTPAWTWWRENRTVGAIARHQVQEVAVHRWDAEASVGNPTALAEVVADDGLDEFTWIARQLRDPAPIRFVATDSGRSVSVANGPAATTVSATASDLVLLLHSRITPDHAHVDGDRATLHAFLVPIA